MRVQEIFEIAFASTQKCRICVFRKYII